jgi:hypothetical protein
MLKRITLLTCALAFSSSLAQAQSGTPQEQDACRRDVTRYCRKVMDQGDFVILDCLKRNAHRISKACHKVLEGHGQL